MQNQAQAEPNNKPNEAKETHFAACVMSAALSGALAELEDYYDNRGY